MSKLIDYPAATRFDSGDILIKDGTNGTKKITAKTQLLTWLVWCQQSSTE